MRRCLRLFAPLSALLLLACGGGGGGDSGGQGDVGNYLPYSVGSRWTYEVSSDGEPDFMSPRHELTQIRSEATVNSAPALLHVTSHLDEASWVTTTLTKTDRALSNVIPADYALNGVTRLTRLRLPLRAGDRYTAYDYRALDNGSDLDEDGRHESIALKRTVHVRGPEAVTTPLGTFTTALRVESVGSFTLDYSASDATLFSIVEATEWYVPDVGLVKSIVNSVDSFGTNTETRVLTGTTLDGVSTDTTPPTVTATVPAADATVEGDTEISISFSEYMDPFTLDAYSFVLVDGNDNPVPSFSVYTLGQRMIFLPENTLAPGTYTATLLGGTDALGNALENPPTWSFTVISPP